MRVTIFITINGRINSRELYELLEPYGVNVTDCGEQTLIYGEAYLAQASQIVFNAGLYGDITVTITHDRSTSDS